MVPVGDALVAFNWIEYDKVLCRGPDAWEELLVGTSRDFSMFLDFCHGAA